MVGEAILNPFSLLVPLASLVEDNINNLVMFTYVLSRSWNKFVSGFAEQLDIAPGIILDTGHKFGNGCLVLRWEIIVRQVADK